MEYKCISILDYTYRDGHGALYIHAGLIGEYIYTIVYQYITKEYILLRGYAGCGKYSTFFNF